MRDLRLVGWVVAGLAGTFAALALAGWLLVKGLHPLRRGAGVAWRYGLANISRRGRDSVVQVVAFGLVIMVLLVLALVRNDLLREWRASLPADAPNYFMINIRPADGAAVREFFSVRGLPPTELVPLVRARLAAVNGVPVDKLHFESDRAQGFVEREANPTWSRMLRDDNRLVAGRWWSAGDGGGARVSVEKEYAERLGLKLGDTLTYDVAGEPVSARIASLRDVRWDSFQPNFFVVFSPGVLEGVTGTLITSVHVDRSQRPLLVDLVRRFPEVTIIDIDALLTQVREVMDKAALSVQYVFAFTLAAGIMVLLAAVQATRDERHFESAILRTLGASRGVVFAGVASCSDSWRASWRPQARRSRDTSWRARFSTSSTRPTRRSGCGHRGGALLVGVAGVAARSP